MINIVIFVLVSIVVLVALSNVTAGKNMNATERNLRMLEERKSYNTIDDQHMKADLGSRLQVFFEQKIDMFYIKNQEPTKTEALEKMVKKVYNNNKTYAAWEYERIMVSLVAFSLGIFAFLLFKEVLILGIALLVPIALYMISESDLKTKSKNKDWENFVFFPDMLMSLCMLYNVGAVSTIFQGFKRVSRVYDHPLMEEVKEAVKEYEFNKDKYDVLNDLAERVDFKEFTSFVNLVIETEKNNIPIAETLTEYAYEISAKRRILATNQILKLPEKIDMVMYLTSMPICFIYMILPSMRLALEQLTSSGVM